MGEKTGISWTDHTFNPWLGCTKVSAACDNCYAEAWAKRYGEGELWQSERRRTSAANWIQPRRWDRAAKSAGVRRRVFCASLADVFDNQVPEEWRADLWALIAECPNLDWQLLTKRPQNVPKMLPSSWDGVWPNVWIGTTAENQVELDRRGAAMQKFMAIVKFVSYEPALGEIDVTEHTWIDWLIAGCESGPKARDAEKDWFISAREQMRSSGAFFMKQIIVDGELVKDVARFPPDLQVQEFPLW